jgi:hypothetical protein
MGKYKIRFIDGPNEGRQEKIEVLFSKITRYPEKGGKPISYYRVDDPRQKLGEYRYSIKP